MPEDWFWGDCWTHFLPKFCGLRKAKKWRLSPPLVLPQPSLAPGGASVVTLATDDKDAKNMFYAVKFGHFLMCLGIHKSDFQSLFSRTGFLSQGTRSHLDKVTPSFLLG